MASLVVEKNLITQQDINYGESQVTQSRGGGNYILDQVRSIYPVNSLAELNALDNTKFNKAVLFDSVRNSYTTYINKSSVWTKVYENFVFSYADIATLSIDIGQIFFLASYYNNTTTGGDYFIGVSSVGLTADIGNISATANPSVFAQRLSSNDEALVDNFGAKGDNLTDNYTAIRAAITSLRRNPISIQQTAGAGATIITAYSSGVVSFGCGVYRCVADSLALTQELGLTIRGQGSRGSNNSVLGATTILITGTSAGFGIQTFGNGARTLTLENLDFCYATSGFTGDLIDNYDSVGLRIKQCYIGTFGNTTPTRLTTAKSLLRQTYDEFTHIEDTVFSGAIDGWVDDATRTVDGSTFGGSLSTWKNVVFYDFTGTMMKSPATRTRQTMKLDNVAFNPITQDCVRAIDFNNIINLTIDNCFCTPSVGNKASSEWLSLINCHGKVSMNFGPLSNAGTFAGTLDISGCTIGGTGGFTLQYGNITAFANKFNNDNVGYNIAPTAALAIKLGPDTFSSNVDTSYYLPADTALIKGKIDYAATEDNSVSKFDIRSARIRLKNVDESVTTTSGAALGIPFTESGRIQVATGAVPQTFTLPDPMFCLHVPVQKFSSSANTLTVLASAGKNFFCGDAAARTSAVATNPGCTIEFTAINATTWIAKFSGAWVFT